MTTIMALPPFDEVASCSKCGSSVVTAKHEADTSHYGCPLGHQQKTIYGPEHIVRHCQRCHFEWEERTLDAIGSEPRDFPPPPDPGPPPHWDGTPQAWVRDGAGRCVCCHADRAIGHAFDCELEEALRALEARSWPDDTDDA